jgi:translation initiation factor 2B subunit (eIF-2B alpha/beta/delta family)
METDPRSELRADHLSGASELVDLAAQAARSALQEVGPDPSHLGPALRRVCRSQPSMAVIQRLAGRALETALTAARSGADPAVAGRQIAEAIDAFVTDHQQAATVLVGNAVRELVPDIGWVATMSRSSLVERTLLMSGEMGSDIRILLCESRPLYEGRALAAKLAAAGLPCWISVDAAGALLLSRADLLLVGADAVRPRTFVNKVGTYPLLLAAREINLDVYVLAQRTKFLPADAALFDLDEREGAEVWPDAAAGIQVVNPTFEEIPLSLTRGVMTEGGLLPPGEAGLAASEVVLPGPLLPAWGAGERDM